MAPLAALAAALHEMAAAGADAAPELLPAVGGWSTMVVPAAETGMSLGTALGLAGTAATVGGTVASGVAANNQAKFAADQEKKAAAEKLAAGSRQAEDTRRKTNILMSNQKAAAAASGAGVTNPTVLDILSDTSGRGEFLADSDLYNGQSAAASSLDSAALLKAKGKSAMTGSWLDALGEGATGGYKFGKSQNYWSSPWAV